MSPLRFPARGRKCTAALVAAAVVWNTLVPELAAAQARVRTGATETGLPGQIGAGLGSGVPTVAPLSLSVSVVPLGTALPTSAAAFVTPGANSVVAPAALGGHARPELVSATPVLRPAAAGPSVVAAQAVAPASRAVVPAQTGTFAALRSALGLGKSAAGESAPLPPAATDGTSKEFADAQFRRLSGEEQSSRPATVAGAASRPAATLKPADQKKSMARKAALAVTGVIGAVQLGLGQNDSHAAGVAGGAPSAQGVLDALGSFGYAFGNALAFIFPIPEIKKAIDKKTAGEMPVGRTFGLVAANLALGFVNAAVAGMPFWGVQNVFGAFAMLAAWPAARWARYAAAQRAAKGIPEPVAGSAEAKSLNRRAWLMTAAVTAITLGASAIAFYGAMAVIPPLLTAALGAAVLGKVTLAIQIITGIGYIFVIRDGASKKKKEGEKPAKEAGFSAGFNMAFLAASFGFMLWTAKAALGASWGSSEQLQFAFYFLLNGIYVWYSGRSWLHARRAQKDAEKGANGDATPAAGDDASSATPDATDGPEKTSLAAATASPRGPPAVFAGMAAAEKTARRAANRRAANARLLRATGEIKNGKARWTFSYHSPAKGLILTYGAAGNDARKTTREARPMVSAEDLAALDVDGSAAALAKAEPAFKIVRVEVVPSKDGARILFYDKNGESRRGPAPLPKEETPAVETPAPVAETPAPVAEPVVPTPEPAPVAAEPEGEFKHLHEDFFGFRTVKGLKRDAELKSLPLNPTTDQVIDHLSRQFGIPRAKLLQLATKYRLAEHSPVEAWLLVHRRMQDANRDRFKRLDSQKYSGWKSFRNLANKTYPEGWRGTLLRISELHKHFLGAAVRFPYHLFDMFVFGYFRQNISYQARHANEDFFAVGKDKELARKWLETSMREYAFNGVGLIGGLRAKPWARALERWLISPLIAPLATFLVRRLTLAIMSAIAMGLIGAFAPALPMSFALTSIPWIGEGLVWALHGIPVAAASIPLVGGTLGPIVAAATAALAKDLVLGPLLNTFTLSTLLTFPRAVREELGRVRDADPMAAPGFFSRATLKAVGRTMVSGGFWKSNGKSFFGLITVGAEIEGIMTYAESIDAAIDPTIEKVTGHKPQIFHTIGAAVERGPEESPIPFGGAITWGNVLLYKLQGALGVNISDSVMNATLGFKSFAGLEGSTDLAQKGVSAEAIVSAFSSRDPETRGLPFDPDLWKKPLAEVEARIKELAAKAGDLDAEIAAVKEHRLQLLAELGDKKARLELLKKRSKPVTPEEQAEYDRLLAELTSKRDEVYVGEKLSQKSDLTTPPESSRDEYERLKALSARYESLLPPPPEDQNGYWEQLAVQEASLKALSAKLENYNEGGVRRDGPLPPVDPATLERVKSLLTEIEALRAETTAEMAQSNAAAQLLSVANSARNKALRDRRDGSEMLSFHQNMSRLATVMDLALSMNEIAAAQAALKQMMDLLEAKRDKINASHASNVDGQNGAAGNQANLQLWEQEAQQTLADDEQTLKDLTLSRTEAESASLEMGNFQTKISGLLNTINNEDKHESPDALTEYNRVINTVLPDLVNWRTNGNPNDPDAFSLKKFNENLAEVTDNITRAEEGLAQLPTVPVEFAGVLVIKVPGPEVSVVNPDRPQTLQILADRRAHWTAKKADFQTSLNTVNRYLDPGNGTLVTDEFGEQHPESLPRWRAQAQNDLTLASGNTRDFLRELDASAAQINAAAGSNIPMLSGLSLKDLQDAIKTYGDKIRAVDFPPSNDANSAQLHAAKMQLIRAAGLVPQAAREVIRWSKADATVTAIDKAMTTTLPETKTKLETLMRMFDDILADVSADENFVNNGVGGGQALIDRKTVLLRDKILPALRDMKTLLTDTLIPYQQESVASAGPDGDFFKLYDAKRTLLTEADKLYKKTIPWAFATYGAEEGDAGAAHASIADFRHRLQRNLDGYTDEQGKVHKGVNAYKIDMVNRRDPNFTGTEVLYGETQPFSLPRKIAQYTAERQQRAEQINTQGAQINEILAKIEQTSHGKYNLSAFRIPVGITPDAAGVARIDGAVDADLIPKLADELDRISDEAEASGSALNIGTGGDGTVPVGTQPPITISENQMISLLCLEVAKRLVPTSLNQPESAPAAYAFARFLYSDSVVEAANEGLTVQVPAAEAFLNKIGAALTEGVAQTLVDDAYVNSNGASETPEQVYARKVANFAGLADALRDGEAFFRLKLGWDAESTETLESVKDYYDAIYDIYEGGQTANANEITAINSMHQALKDTYDELEADKRKVSGWLAQLNDPHESALRRVSDDVSKIQVKTRAVLESNIRWHELQDQITASKQIVAARLTELDDRQAELMAIVSQESMQGALPADVVRRIEALRLGRGGWQMDDSKTKAQSVVVRKSEYTAFLDVLLGMFNQGGQNISSQDLSAIKADLLRDPRGLSALIPNAAVMDFGDTADGFYLVYQSNFSVPNGLETGSWITLGNIGKVWGSNISVSGYQFASPPNDNNAPYGDKGVEVQVETLTGKNWVNYLNVDLHRFALDIPDNSSFRTGAQESRLMVFDDFAMMAFGDRLYVGLAGFGDFATSDTENKPYYYGGNLKTSIKLTEVMRLNAEQQELFAKDPRKFAQSVNLDFTGYDPDLNREWLITAEGENKHFSRTQVGPSFDINRLLNPDGGGDTFTVDMYYSKVSGTDDYNQQAGGATILKGFSIKNDKGHEWMRIDNRLNGEMGEKFNSVSDRLSVSFPDQGLVISGEGRMLGTAQSYYAEVSKKTGKNSSMSIGYGSPYVGMNNRLQIQMNSSFTLGELWSTVTGNAQEGLKGGETLKAYNKELDEFFKAEGSPRSVQELHKVFQNDIARQLITQDMGTLTRDIQELRKAGAFLDNTRVRGMVGFVSGPVSEDLAERAVGGGMAVGAYTEMTLTKTQKDLLESKTQSLYREGLRLQDRMLTLTKNWQASVVEMAEAQWELKMANFTVQNAPSEAVRAEAKVRLATAEARLHQALLRYNSVTGRDPLSPMPFNDLSSEDLQSLLASISKTINTPDRLTEILGGLDQSQLEATLGKDKFNLLDWIPWVDRLSIGYGVQIQDLMANQALTLGVSIRIPVYDPASKEADKAYVLESAATKEEMLQAYRDRTLAWAQEAERARLLKATAASLAPRGPEAATRLADAIRAYRNGLIGPDQMRAAFDDWNFYMTATLQASAQSALSEAQSNVDAPFASPLPRDRSSVRVSSLEEAFTIASGNSHNLAEVALRQQAAEQMAVSADHRIQKFWVDVNIGAGLTAQGVGWLPSIGVTGIPITPVLGFELKPQELRELQVTQHEQQAEYYEALKTRLEAGLAVQFYQNVVAYRSAEQRMALYDKEILPKLEAEVASNPSGQRRLDEAWLARDQAQAEFVRARATLNYLLGRDERAPLKVDMDEAEALASLTRILNAKDPVGTNKRILDARVETARAVEEMVDKNLKIEVLQLEPVSMVVRSLSRLLASFSDGAFGNPEQAAAARAQVLNEERARDAYDAQRASQTSRLRLQLSAARDRLASLEGRTDADALLERNELTASVFTLKAGLIALGVDPDAVPSDAGSGALPTSWAELKGRLATAEQSLVTVPVSDRVDLIEPEVLKHRSAAYARYYFAHQTLGHEPLGFGIAEGWVEFRLKDPSTPPEVLIALAKLRSDKADRIYRNTLIGATSRADILAAEFESDVRLLRWVDEQIRTTGHSAQDGKRVPAAELDEVRRGLVERLNDARARMVAALSLPAGTSLDALMRLVPESEAPAKGLPDLAGQLIDDIRDRQIGAIRTTLFEGSMPESFGNEDNIMGQIRADVIAERMSYKGFTPVAAFGTFRGREIGSLFIEAPDPREIELGLERIMSDVLRKELQSSGRLKELSLNLHMLMSRVQDGAKGLELRRQLIESAEADLRARAEISGTGSAEYLAAQKRLIAAWSDFSAAMVRTKSDFITLVTELEALGEGSTASLRPFQAPLNRQARQVRPEVKDDLLDYWSERYADPSFDGSMDALLLKLGPAVPPETRARILTYGEQYRQALKDASAVRSHDLPPGEKFDLLVRNDAEGKRLQLRAELAVVLRGVSALGTSAGSPSAELMAFLRADLDGAVRAGAATRADKLARLREMREAFFASYGHDEAMTAAFGRLEERQKELDLAWDALLVSYLTDATGDAGRMVLKDLQLDAYLKAQKAFDDELIKTLEGPDGKGLDASTARGLDALYDIRGILERETARARHGRGMAALDALIALEESRLLAARWGHRPPAETDRIAEALRLLRETRARWLDGKDDLQPLYALTRLDGDRRTWAVDQWLTADEFKRLYEAGLSDPGAEGVIVERGGKFFVDRVAGGTARYEVIGGVDAAAAMNEDATVQLTSHRELMDLRELMKTQDFVAPGGPDGKGQGWSFEQVFGPNGLHRAGRVFFFEVRTDGKPARALHPLAALSLPPEQVAMRVYLGDAALRRDRYPTLESLKASEEAADFRELVVSARGAEALVENARRWQASELRRGWLEVKLNGYGFARDENGQVSQLYRTKDDFEAQWKAYDNATRDLETAKREQVAAQAEADARKLDAERAKGEMDRVTLDYQGAQMILRDLLSRAMIAEGLDAGTPAFRVELERRTAEPSFRKLPKPSDPDLAAKLEKAHDAYQDARERMEKASKGYGEAADKHKQAAAKATNAATAVKEAETTLARSGTWTLHRSSDLTLSLDAEGRVVSVKAPAARGASALDQTVFGGGPATSALNGQLYAAVLDEDGRLLKSYTSDEAAANAAAGWTLRSYDAGGDRTLNNADGTVRTKVRFSRYEETVNGKSLPVLLNQTYLAERLDGARSGEKAAGRWSYMPWNWGNIVLEIPRGIVQTPLELVTGRDPRSHHYLGRAYMYKTEGGETQHHGFFRKALGVVDVLDLLPDPVDRFFDPSQFPDAVTVDSPIRPGEGLFDKDLRNPLNGKDVHFGVMSMNRYKTQAAEDVDAARVRTLSRFHGGVETLTLETRRGRDGFYQESSLTADTGLDKFNRDAVTRGLLDPLVAADPNSDGRGEVVSAATPGAMVVEKVERRVRIMPGAAQYGRQASALDGYAERLNARGEEQAAQGPGLESNAARTGAAYDASRVARDQAAAEERDLWVRWHRLAYRIGEQRELEKRIAVLEGEIKELTSRIAWWDSYLKSLEAARRGGGTNPTDPDPTDPDPIPTNPWASGFWALILALFFIGAIFSALWHALRARRPRPA